MISVIFILFVKKLFSIKSIFFKILLELFAIFFTLSVVYYASKSFSLKAPNGDIPLFVFLIVGEIALVLPMSFSERIISNFIEIKNQYFYQTLVGLRISPYRFIFTRTVPDMIFPLIRVIVILGYSFLFLNLNLSIISFFYFLILQAVSAAMFSTMAMSTTLLYLKFNRGVGFLYTLQSFSMILGGAYFPISIFPVYLKNISTLLPQTQILLGARLIFQDLPLPASVYTSVIVWLIISAIVWFILNTVLVKGLKQKAKFF